MLVQEPLFRLFPFRSLGSTMDEARALARRGFSGAAIVRADTQTSGRGRIGGRRWVDSPGQSLLMTLLLPAGFNEGQALPLRAGLGVVRALERVSPAGCRPAGCGSSGTEPAAQSPSPEFWLKWPNDVLARKSAGAAFSPAAPSGAAGYGKLCGILCESAGGRILIGIGVNLRRAAPAQPQPDIQPACLEETWGFLPPPFGELDGAAQFVARHVTDALSDPRWRSEYERRLWGLGSTLRFLAGHPQSPESVQGTCVGVDGEGRLILDIGGEQKTFASGEIASLRLV